MAKPSQIKPLGQRGSKAKMLLVAPPGFGKTVFGASGEGVLFLTTDPEGTESAYFLGLKADEWEAPKSADIYACIEYLENGGYEDYNWLVVDNVGQAQKIFRKRSMDDGRKRNPNRDEFVPSLDDHQRSQIELEEFVKRVNEINMNILWISHQELNEDGNGEIFYSPAIHGQKGAVAQAVAGLMKIVCYGEIVDEEGDGSNVIRRFWFTKYGPFSGKDRFNTLGPYRDNLTLKELDDILEAKRERAAAKAEARKKTRTTATRATKPVSRAKRATSTGKR